MNTILAEFYERDLGKMIDEISAFRNEENLWKTHGSIRNSSGNLALHIIGGSNYLIGTLLANTGYVRNRDQEFALKNVPKQQLVEQLAALIPLVTQTIRNTDLAGEYPIPFDGVARTNVYLFTQLLAHLNYHLGQVNYLRRMLE